MIVVVTSRFADTTGQSLAVPDFAVPDWAVALTRCDRTRLCDEMTRLRDEMNERTDAPPAVSQSTCDSRKQPPLQPLRIVGGARFGVSEQGQERRRRCKTQSFSQPLVTSPNLVW
jgi:hypothetical protein